MIINKDKGILKTLAAFELFENLFESIPSRTHEFCILLKNGKYIVLKQQVKDKLQVNRNDNYFCFSSVDIVFQKTALPDYLQVSDGITKKGRYGSLNTIELYSIAVNALTVNKTIQELYDLGKWCGLWE